MLFAGISLLLLVVGAKSDGCSDLCECANKVKAEAGADLMPKLIKAEQRILNCYREFKSPLDTLRLCVDKHLNEKCECRGPIIAPFQIPDGKTVSGKNSFEDCYRSAKEDLTEGELPLAAKYDEEFTKCYKENQLDGICEATKSCAGKAGMVAGSAAMKGFEKAIGGTC